MKRLLSIRNAISAIGLLLTAFFCGCSENTGTGLTRDSENLTANQGEHDRDSGEGREKGHERHDRDGREHHGEEGEESGTELTLSERYDDVRNGVRLVLAHDAPTNSFSGTVENTTGQKLERVRFEVHLSNGKELGPTTPADLGPSEKRDVKLTATSKNFDGWTAHPEVGSSEHGHGGEHGREGRGEHDRDGDDQK